MACSDLSSVVFVSACAEDDGMRWEGGPRRTMNHCDLDGKCGVKMEPSCRCVGDKGAIVEPRTGREREHAEELGFGLGTLCVYGTFAAEVWRVFRPTSVLLIPLRGFLALQMEMQGQQRQD